MFGGRAFTIARIRGIPVRVDSSWIFIALFVVYSLVVQYTNGYGMQQSTAVPLAVFTAFLFFGSILGHELSHALIARLRNVEVSSITLYFFGGATATKLDKQPGDQFLISAAGPGASLLIGAVFWLISREAAGHLVAISFGYVGWINVVLAIFNVVPGYPLDGGQMLRAAVWRISGNEMLATKVATVGGFIVGGGLLFLGGLALYRGDVGGGIWIGFIGWFLIQNAQAATKRTTFQTALRGATVQQAMGAPPASIPSGMALSQVLEQYLRGHEHEAFPVVENGALVGLMTFDSASRVGQVNPFAPAREAMIPMEEVSTVSADAPLQEALQRLGGNSAALVLREGALVGALTPGDVNRWAAANRAG
ncbi:MAG: M50 family metallopeptidase [Actinomycetota bacterium]